MALEGIGMQARDPVRTGRFWAVALGLVGGSDGAEETYAGRLTVPGGPWLDIGIDRVPHAPPPGWRLHLDLAGGQDQEAVVRRLLGLGARHLDIGQRMVPWVVLADPDGNPFCVMEDREVYRGTGPLAALPLDSGDPERDGELYAVLTGWVQVPGVAPVTLRHPSLTGPLLELCPEAGPKLRQNRTHLDVRPEPGGPGQAGLVEAALSLGATRVEELWAQGHPWVVLRDTSGNELCVLADLPPPR